jgi:hypothetical protein
VLLAFFLLLALLAQAVVPYWPRRLGWVRYQGSLPLAALVVLGYGTYRLAREQRILSEHQAEDQALHQAYGWLRTQPLRRVWVMPRAWLLKWHHYALADSQPLLPLVEVTDEVPLSLHIAPLGEVIALPAPPLGYAASVLYQAGQRVFIVPMVPVNK